MVLGPLHSFTLVALLLAQGAEAAPMSLQDLYLKAVARSEVLGQTKLDVTRQERAIDEARAGRGARVHLQAGLDEAYSKVPARSWQSDTVPRLDTEFRYPLYDGGSTRARIEAAQRLRDAATWEVAREKEDLFLQCAELFYNVLGIEQDLRNLRDSASIYSDRVETLTKREKIGRSRTAEVLAARTQLQVIRSQIVDAENRLHLNQERLAWLIDAKPPLSLRDDITLTTLQSKSLPLRSIPLPAVESSRARLDAASFRIDQEKAAGAPLLDFIAAHRWSVPQDTSTHVLSFGLGLSWQIYDAGQLEASVGGYSIERQRAALAADIARREAELNQNLVKREWEDGLNQLKDLDLALNAAKQNVKVQQQEFENGLLTNLEVMQALDTQLQVRRTIDQTLFRTKYVYLEAQLRAGQIPYVRPDPAKR